MAATEATPPRKIRSARRAGRRVSMPAVLLGPLITLLTIVIGAGPTLIRPPAAAAGERPSDAAARLGSPAKLRIAAVGTHRLVLAWKDRARGERSFRAKVVGGQRGPRVARAGRNAERITVAGLEPGAVYRASVRACAGKRCSKPRRARPTATLLAPFGGPHPSLGCEVLPASDEFNRDVSNDPLDPRSDGIIDRILADGGDDLHPDFGSNPSYGIPYVVVPGVQPGVPIRFTAYGDESDPGPYPVPPGAPIEGGRGSDGDRHVLVVRRPAAPGGSCELHELYRAFERGDTRNRWQADAGAVFDLGAPLAGQRPAGWTSADAAGLPIFPGLVTYEEVASGEIDHAIRITFERTRRGYIPPATHWASDSCDRSRPAMGMRLRLAAGYDTSALSGDAAVIARALQRYGAIVADNGSNFFISGSTDARWNDGNLNQLKAIPGTAFEVLAPAAAEVSDC